MDNAHKNRHRRYTPPHAEVKGDKAILDKPIESIDLPEDTLTLLKNNKFNTVYDIAKRTERDMFRVQTFNKKHLLAVKRSISPLGIDFLPPVKREKNDVTDTDNSGRREAPRDAGKHDDDNDRQGAARRIKNQKSAPNGADNGNKPKKNSQTNQQSKQQSKQQPKQRLKQPRPERKPRVLLPLEQWEKVQKNGKWGFGNGLNIVIQPRFDEVFCFKDGLACVDDGGMFGYINDKGDYVIEPKFECAMSFSEGLAVFFEGEKCGYINKEGNVVISAKYDAATAFENGRAKVKELGKWSTIDPDGTVLWSK